MTAGLTAVFLIASPLLATAATWNEGRAKCARPAARKIGCHESKTAATARKVGCHGSTASKAPGQANGCCCRTSGAISATHCGCRHDAPPAMTRDSAVPPGVMLLRTVQPQTPCEPWVPNAPDGLPLAPPDPPPRSVSARTSII